MTLKRMKQDETDGFCELFAQGGLIRLVRAFSWESYNEPPRKGCPGEKDGERLQPYALHILKPFIEGFQSQFFLKGGQLSSSGSPPTQFMGLFSATPQQRGPKEDQLQYPTTIGPGLSRKDTGWRSTTSN